MVQEKKNEQILEERKGKSLINMKRMEREIKN